MADTLTGARIGDTRLLGKVSMHIAALDDFLPMHVLLTADGRIRAAGRTLRRLLPPDGELLGDAFALTRPFGQDDDLEALVEAARTGERIFLRMVEPPHLTLRGHVVKVNEDELLINMGFGIALTDAVRELGLKDHDFAPTELAMELLFLHEANRAVMGELSRFNLRLEEAREVAELQAFTDPLTGLYNRRGLELALAVALRADGGGQRRAARGFAIAHLDLDRFKEVNDQYGHAAGDLVLQRVAKVLRSETRSNDTVARVGGDEFVLILASMISVSALEGLARRIISEIEQPIQLDGKECTISASIGIAMSSSYGMPNAEQMLADADAALYASKNAGRARATIHDADPAAKA